MNPLTKSRMIKQNILPEDYLNIINSTIDDHLLPVKNHDTFINQFTGRVKVVEEQFFSSEKRNMENIELKDLQIHFMGSFSSKINIKSQKISFIKEDDWSNSDSLDNILKKKSTPSSYSIIETKGKSGKHTIWTIRQTSSLIKWRFIRPVLIQCYLGYIAYVEPP
jgi:hypothetical protein